MELIQIQKYLELNSPIKVEYDDNKDKITNTTRLK